MLEPGNYESIEVRGHREYVVSNEKIDMSMKVVPGLSYKDGHIVQNSNVAEVWFAFSSNKGIPEENWDWPYFITQKDLGTVDTSDPDYIDEIFGKYFKQFQSVRERPSTDINERLASYQKFIGQIFPDIEEKRKAENRTG